MKNSAPDAGKNPEKKYPVIGVCGLDCGLCPRFYTDGPSRCPGCAAPGFFSKHPSCSFITCCVKKKNLEVCSDCSEFPCAKFKSVEEYDSIEDSASYASHKKMLPNLFFIKEHGIEKFIELQARRIKLLQKMINNYNDGRSRSFFCRAACQCNLEELEKSLEKASEIIKSEKISADDLKGRAGVVRKIINEIQ